MRALAGLGNPGSEYVSTRHNAGWMLLDRLRAVGKVVEERQRESVQLERLKLGPAAVWLMRPLLFVNNSGVGISEACRALDIQPGDVLVAYDEIDLPLGSLRLRPSGGDAGHRGLKSVIEELGTQRVPRLRLGVRGEGRSLDTAGYVLDAFDDTELVALDEMLDRAVAAVRSILRRGLSTTMNTYNQRPNPETTNPQETPD
jgi:PTH1 family peptidyl-tRNA hydrolase